MRDSTGGRGSEPEPVRVESARMVEMAFTKTRSVCRVLVFLVLAETAQCLLTN
jgi:hypothetical protein